jgi:hypothetical protein
MEKAVIIKADGSRSVAEFELEGSYHLLESTVGGYFQVLPINSKVGEVDLWVNEEGKLEGLPQNPIATALWVESYGLTDYCVGDVVITGGVNYKGITIGLSDEKVEYFMEYDRQVHLIL